MLPRYQTPGHNTAQQISSKERCGFNGYTERQIQIALDDLRTGRTTLIIAHRLSTVENADRIVVLHYGRIVEQGKHSELLQRHGLYASRHRSQTTAVLQQPIGSR